MAQLAREAEVSRATLYRRFASRVLVEQALRERGEKSSLRFGSVEDRTLDAVAHFAEAGTLSQISLEEIAQEAQVGIASIYRLFKNREGLLGAFAQKRSPQSILERGFASETSLADILEEIAMALAQQLYIQPPELQRRRAGDFARVEQAGREKLVAFFDLRVRGGELHGVPESLARNFLALMAGHGMLARVEGRPPRTEDVHSAVRLFLRAAANKASQT